MPSPGTIPGSTEALEEELAFRRRDEAGSAYKGDPATYRVDPVLIAQELFINEMNADERGRFLRWLSDGLAGKFRGGRG